MIDRMDILNASTLLMGLARAQIYNDDIIDPIAKEILKKNQEGIFFEKDSVQESVNILSSLSDLGY